MRRFTCLAVGLLCLTVVSHAQIAKGSILLGGSFGLNSNSTERNFDTLKSTHWSFSPTIGLAIKENTILGLNLGYGSSVFKKTPGIEQYNYHVGLFLRKYKPLGKGFYLFGEGNLNYGKGRYENNTVTSGTRSVKMNNVSLGIFPGLSYAVSKSFYLETALMNLVYAGFSETRNEYINPGPQEEVQRNFSFGFGAGGNIPISLGFRFIFPKK